MRRTDVIQIRVSPEEKELFQGKADRQLTSVSDWLRQLALDAPEQPPPKLPYSEQQIEKLSEEAEHGYDTRLLKERDLAPPPKGGPDFK